MQCKLYGAVAACLLSGQVGAAEWWYTGSGSSGEMYFVDKASEVREPHTVSFWIRRINVSGDGEFRDLRWHVAARCQTRQISLKLSIGYDDRGAELDRFDYGEGRWDTVVPDTPKEDAFTLICGGNPRREPVRTLDPMKIANLFQID